MATSHPAQARQALSKHFFLHLQVMTFTFSDAHSASEHNPSRRPAALARKYDYVTKSLDGLSWTDNKDADKDVRSKCECTAYEIGIS